MITNYQYFLNNLNINESFSSNLDVTKEDFEAVKEISKIVSQMEKDDNIYAPFSKERENSKEYPFLLGQEITKFENLFRITQKSVLNKAFYGIPYDQYSRGLVIYVRTKTYNKLVSILYGKEYVTQSGFNPMKDATEIDIINKSGVTSRSTRGKLFSDYWSNLEENCENAVEYLLKGGKITDVLGDSIVFSMEIVAITAICFAIGLIIGGSGGTATPAVAAVVPMIEKGAYFAGLMKRYGKYIDWGKIKLIIEKSWSFLVKVFTSRPGEIAINLATLKILEDYISSEPTIAKDSLIALQNPEDKKIQIMKIKDAIEQHTDFTINNSFSIYDYSVSQMPGWKEWSVKTGKLTNKELQYELAWYVSQYCYEYQLFCNGYKQLVYNRDAYWVKEKKV